MLVHPDDGSIEVIAAPEGFDAVMAAFEAAGLEPDEQEITLRADNGIAVSGDVATSVARLLDWLEDLDDVQNVYSNADLPADAHDH